MESIKCRKAQTGDEKILTYIQTESWKAAFRGILEEKTLQKYTQTQEIEEFYRKILLEQKANILILFVNESAQGIAGWIEAKQPTTAELVCIHSLCTGWGKGYGDVLMEQVLCEIKNAGFEKVVLWVFEQNKRARKFYEKHNFVLSQASKNTFGAREVMYSKRF